MNQPPKNQPIANQPGNADQTLSASDAALLADAEPLPNPGKIVSGAYGAMLLGVAANGEITGDYSDWTGAGQYKCDFYIRGKLHNGAADITTWFPKDKEIIRGRLKYVEENGTAGVNIKLAAEPGGCGNLSAENGSTHPLYELGEWQAVRVVSAAKAFFHSRPNKAAKQKAFVVEYDAVRVYNVQNGWIEAEFGNGCVDAENSPCKTTKGWLKKADLFSPEPPE